MQKYAILPLIGALACIAATALADPTNVRLADAKPGTAPPSIQLAKPQADAASARPLAVSAARPQVASASRPQVASASPPQAASASRPQVATASRPQVASDTRPQIPSAARPQAASARVTADAAMTSVRQQNARDNARMMLANAASHAPTIARSAANRKGKGQMTTALRPKPNKSL
jgi:hypothetical protein